MSIDYSDMAFPKTPWKKKDEPKAPWERNRTRSKKRDTKPKKRKKKKYRKIPSIMHDKSEGRCFLSMLLDDDYRVYPYLEEHHVIFGDEKWVSDAFGLRVYLRPEYHRIGPAAVHNNQENAELLKRLAQQAFIEHYPELKWHDYVEKNYLEVEDETAKEIKA